MTHEEILKDIVEVLHQTYPQASIGVGGSLANGTYRVDSDVDLLFLRQGQMESYSITFCYKGVQVSIFSFSHAFWQKNDRKYLYGYHNMPMSFVKGVVPIYDENRLIQDLKDRVEELVNRRVLLKHILINELTQEGRALLSREAESVYMKKLIHYRTIEMLINQYFLEFYSHKVTGKQIEQNVYEMIARNDRSMYTALYECMPYCLKANQKLKFLFEQNKLKSEL